MAIFRNNLDTYITLIQQEELIESHHERFKRYNHEMSLKIMLTTGAVAATTITSLQLDRPELLFLNLGCIVIINSSFNLYNARKYSKMSYKIDYDNLQDIDYKKFLRSKREIERLKGNLKYTSPSKYYRDDAENIEKHFGYDSDNDLPIQFLPTKDVPNQVLDEYHMFNQKYNLPELNISEEELTKFVEELEKWLKSKMLSHRIYFYTSEYFKRILAKGIINYWDEITTETLIEQLYCFKSQEYTDEEINEFKEKLKEVFAELDNYKKKLNK